MKILNINHMNKSKAVKVLDCVVERGYWKVAHASLPD